MSIEEAYSLEIGQVIDAEVAYDLYWSGKLTDKQKFICAGDNCTAQITCAGIDIPEQNQKQVPHFRMPSDTHSENCSLFKDEYQIDHVGGGNSTTRGSNQVKSKKEKFNFSRPVVDTDIDGSKEPPVIKITPKSTGNGGGYSQSNNIKRMYSLRPVIKNWLKYRNANTLDKHYIDMERDISYANLFKGVFRQNIDNYPDENLIFYGKAFIDKLKDDKGYRLKFLEPLKITIDEKVQEIKPTFFVSKEMIENYPIKSLLTTRLKKIEEKKQNIAAVFIYSKPILNVKYINFNLKSLDLLEIRYLDFYQQIYNR